MLLTQLVIVIDTRGKNSRSQIYIISYIDNKSIYGKLGRATLNIAKKRMTLLIAQHSISNDYSHFFFFSSRVFNNSRAKKEKKSSFHAEIKSKTYILRKQQRDRYVKRTKYE